MSSVASLSPLTTISEKEWQTRVDLAALYRLFVRYGWTDLIYTHISARVPDEDQHYLINPFGPMFDEMTASNLIKVDFDGNVLDGSGEDYNEAGHLIHTAVLKARPDVNFVLHTHSCWHRGICDEMRATATVPACQYHQRLCGLSPIRPSDLCRGGM